MRRWVAVLGGVVAIGIALIAWRTLREDRPARRHATAKSRLDVVAFRAQLALRVKRAKNVAARRKAEAAEPVATEKPRSKAWARLGSGAGKMSHRDLLDPRCWFGPLEVCESLGPLVDECDGGDAISCIAVGQYLADNPPRILIANMFFYQACRIGDSAGCERLDDLEPGATGECEEDPWACGWRAYKTKDYAKHEEACTLGAAESCTMIAAESNDPDVQRAYYETACQLGHSLVCDALATLLAPDCEDDEGMTCLPIDEDGAARAREMACAAGFSERCTGG